MAAGVILKTPMIVKLVTMPSFILVGGLEHGLYFFHSVGNVIIPTDELHHFSQ